jgi:hypothetical protein
MSELSAAAAAALGVPEAIVLRSAAARATETGMTVDEVLSAWAGGGSVAASSPPPADAPADETPEPAPEPEPAATPPPEEKAAAPAAAAVSAPPGVTTRAPVPSEVTPAQAAGLDEVVTVPTAGIRERTNFVLPRWLAWVMLIIPLFALFALGGAATGTCGEATELQTDVISGEIVNCDGSEFTGSGIGGGSTDFIALGERIYNGEGATCAGCHGAGGGGGAGPALTGVLTTFSVCADHMAWVRLGSAGTQAEGENTYGDTDKPINGGMPSHDSLTDEQLASVVSFERVRFGGADPAQTLIDCGLAAGEGEGGTTVPGEGGTTVPGEGGTTVPGEGGTTVPGETPPTTQAG